MGEGFMKKILLGVALFHLGLVPAFADVIPTRRTERNVEAEQKVKARLEQLGVTADEANRQVRSLTPQETNYFAQNPERLQLTSGLYWYEWLGGLALIALIVIFVFIRP